MVNYMASTVTWSYNAYINTVILPMTREKSRWGTLVGLTNIWDSRQETHEKYFMAGLCGNYFVKLICKLCFATFD